jgi:glucosamine--fructose-6-phosphate aminotransferase (isomerizing)
MDTTAFDPTAPLPGPPDPWASTDTPSHRDAPPFHMTEMIAAEPWIVERILAAQAAKQSGAADLASAIRRAIRVGTPVVVTGCGTSEHGALAVVEILREALRTSDVRAPGHSTAHELVSAQAFELSLDPPASGLVIGISHEGATGATNAALTAARAAGAGTAIITVSDRSPGAAIADIVVATEELDQSWCHTVGYVSPIAAATAVAGHLTGSAVKPDAARDLVRAGLADEPASRAEALAGALSGVDRLLVLASGADRPAGRELVLKVEEGAWLPAAYRDLETFLHGHLAATDATTAVFVIATDRRARDARLARVRAVLAAARVIGMPTAAIVTDASEPLLPAELTSAGRIVVEAAPDDVPAAVASLLGSATALQTLTERLATARGINPDPIHRDVDRYREAADAADAAV